MRLPAELAILLFSTAAIAQTQWITATIDNQVVSWIWSVTPSSAIPTATSSSSSLTTSSSSSVSSTVSTTSATSTTSSTSTSRSTKRESSISSSSAESRDTSSITTSTSSFTISSSTSYSSTTSSTPASTSQTSTSSSSSIPLTTSISTTSSSSSALSTSSDNSISGITLTQAAAPIPSSSLTDNSSSASSGGLSNNNTLLKIILSVVISILAVLILAILLFLCLRRRRRSRDASRGSFSPVDQEKNPVETAYLGHGEPTLPQIHTPMQSDLQLHMPKPTVAPGMRQLRQDTQDTLYEPSPIEPDHARNPFMGSQERLGALLGPAPARGVYRPLHGKPTKHTMAISHELPAQQVERPPISALNSSVEASHDSRPSSDGYSYGDLGGSGYGDLGLVGQSERYQDEPSADRADSRYSSAARPTKRTSRPPSVVASSIKPWLYTNNTARPPHFYRPADERQSFDFGFGRPDSGIAATGYRKSPSASVDERAPMAVSPEEEEEAEDEAGTGGMVPLGQASRTPPSAGRKSSLRRESLNDRLGSLRRTASVSVRRSSVGSGGSRSGRFSIPRRPVGE